MVPQGKIFFIWPHINGYLISLILFVLAITSIRDSETEAQVLPIFYLTAACFFHEFVSAAILVSISIFLLVLIKGMYSKGLAISADFKIGVLLIPLIVFICSRFWVVEFLAPIQNESSILSGLDIDELYSIAVSLFGLILSNVPQKQAAILVSLSIPALVLFNIYFGLKDRNLSQILVSSSLIALMALLSLRVIERGSISPWYVPFFGLILLFNGVYFYEKISSYAPNVFAKSLHWHKFNINFWTHS